MKKDWRKVWKKVSHSIVVRKYRNILKRDWIDINVRKHAEWRLAFNLYQGDFLYEALEIFEKICESKDGLDDRSHVHHSAGLCCVKLFHETHLHTHLENAYKHYQNSIETMHMNIFAMFQLPHLLLEFGHVLENYGAFESALDVYTRILTYFPNTRGYFDAMYRSAIIAKHIADFSDDKEHREETILRCIDILQFLLEAVPPSISEVHAVFLYARTLQESEKESNRRRAQAVLQSLFDLCRHHQPPLAKCETFQTFQNWEYEPEVWWQFCVELKDAKEPLILREAHDRLLECVELRRMQGADVSNLLTTTLLLDVAKNRAKFQHYEEAIHFAEEALERDHYHVEARSLLTRWSKTHRMEFEMEADAVNTLSTVWKRRCWTPGFRKRLKQNVLSKTEEAYNDDPLNVHIRSTLAYYARDRWRARFLFENECAKRIQDAYRVAKLRWTWQTPIRAAFLRRAVITLQQYKKKPFDRDIRMAVHRTYSNPFCPKDHEIRELAQVFRVQERALVRIVRLLKHCIFKSHLREAIDARNLKRLLMETNHALRIQCAMRCALARRALVRARWDRERRVAAATKLQTTYRGHIGSVRLLALKMARNRRLQREDASRFLAKAIPSMISGYRARCILRDLRAEKAAKEAADREWNRPERVRARRRWASCLHFALLAARNRLNTESLRFYNLIMSLVRARRSGEFSCAGLELLAALRKDSNAKYHPPGVRKATTQFQRALQQSALLCDISFSHIDAQMLAAVLRHPHCRVQELTFLEVDASHPSFEVDLVRAAGDCRSLRSVRVFAGTWSETVLTTLMNVVQVENPYVKELVIESVPGIVGYSDVLARAGGLLVADYFNYSVPGLFRLSLHGLGIKDVDLEMLGKGLSCNRCLRDLCLSHNLVSDEGLIHLIRACTSNTHLCLEKLDMRWNLIQGTVKLLEVVSHALRVIAAKTTANFVLDLVKNPLRNLDECEIVVRFGVRTVVTANYQEEIDLRNSLAPVSPTVRLLSPSEPSHHLASRKQQFAGGVLPRPVRNNIALLPLHRRVITPGRVKPMLKLAKTH